MRLMRALQTDNGDTITLYFRATYSMDAIGAATNGQLSQQQIGEMVTQALDNQDWYTSELRAAADTSEDPDMQLAFGQSAVTASEVSDPVLFTVPVIGTSILKSPTLAPSFAPTRPPTRPPSPSPSLGRVKVAKGPTFAPSVSAWLAMVSASRPTQAPLAAPGPRPTAAPNPRRGFPTARPTPPVPSAAPSAAPTTVAPSSAPSTLQPSASRSPTASQLLGANPGSGAGYGDSGGEQQSSNSNNGGSSGSSSGGLSSTLTAVVVLVVLIPLLGAGGYVVYSSKARKEALEEEKFVAAMIMSGDVKVTGSGSGAEEDAEPRLSIHNFYGGAHSQGQGQGHVRKSVQGGAVGGPAPGFAPYVSRVTGPHGPRSSYRHEPTPGPGPGPAGHSSRLSASPHGPSGQAGQPQQHRGPGAGSVRGGRFQHQFGGADVGL